ncbi:dehydrogenase [Bellilinea caldifistulae]|uniref:Oxidoreductase n=1 Tax=Bellilinea caldifistulae TaxID=360411 RepID=A0A0P6XQ99_9CHLR|nr:FAD-dependent oxidoreductase [Bellilinea caldifistulae]KPL74443.1 oxidoreductase [Bellilinea caldifistulae]GAP11622.1 dehydrogenase [Bellilinea caldifistulae]
MSDDKLDAIVVGAGVAGCTVALLLAQEGLEVALIERGPFPGSKNLSGGVLYGQVLHQIIPNFWKKAPVERVITNQAVTFLTETDSVSLDFKTPSFLQKPYNAVSVLRSKFDRWLGEQAEKAGAILIPGIKVERLIREENRIIGIAAGQEEMFADVVIAADGANSFLAQEAGLRQRIPEEHVAVGIKEVIALPQEVIENRFRLEGNEGSAFNIVGSATQGIAGGGFLYTNQESISIGLVIQLADLVQRQKKVSEIFDQFLNHPWIASLIKGGKVVEYGAHLVPEAGLKMIPRLFMDGMVVIGDAAGLTINNGFWVRGMDLAIGSAIAAAEAVVKAHQNRDFSAESLALYRQKLEESFVMADLRTYAHAPHFMQNARLYKRYPQVVSEVFRQIYQQDASPHQPLRQIVRDAVRSNNLSLLDLVKDFWNGGRAL